MSLIKLKTNLTSLKFGNDRPGYGSSNLPYIQTQIPSAPDSPGLFEPMYRPGSTGDLDFPIRGGGLGGFSLGLQTFTLSSQVDKTRIRKFFEDQPRGPIFLRKQVGLQLTNPKMETGNTLFGLGQTAPLPGLLENTRVYDPTGRLTLAQVGAMGSGAHAIRSGLIAFAPTQKHYFDVVNQQNTNNITSINRLVNLTALKMVSGNNQFINPTNVPDYERVNTLGISLNRNLLFQYLGGPGSVYGAGTTTIRRAVDTTKLTSRNAMTYDQLRIQDVNNYANGTATKNIQDFYQERIRDINDPAIVRYNAQIDAVERRLERDPDNKRLQNRLAFLQNNPPALISSKGLKPWGNQTVDKRFYVAAGEYKDKLNKSLPFIFNNAVAPWELNKPETDDLIKFVFEAISNDDPSYSTAIFFRAFLTAGITDNHSAQLNSFKYIGRGENFYTYQGFDRSVSFSFRVAAGSKEELKPMYNRLNTLVSQVYPDYSPTTKIMRAPLIRLTVGDYFYRMPGFLESVNITVDNGYPWEINLDGDLSQLPQVVDVSISFKPILAELPKRASAGNIIAPTEEISGDAGVESTGGELSSVALIANDGNTIQNYLDTVAQRSIKFPLQDVKKEPQAFQINANEIGPGTPINLD